MGEFLLQATVYLAAAVAAVPLAQRLGLGSVLGYIIAGAIIGEINVLMGMSVSDLHHFGEFGVVLLLFVIGLELDPKSLWNMRNKLIGMGGLQIFITTVAIAAGSMLLGLSMGTSIAIGMAFALSSTAIVLQTLSEKGLTQTEGGRSGLSVLLMQDVAFIPMLIIIPLLATGAGQSVTENSHNLQNSEENIQMAKVFIEHLPPWGTALVTLGSIAFIIGSGYFLVRPMFRYINSAGLLEITTAVTLLIVCFAALLMTIVGLSPALGTFLAGVMLANSEFKHELEANIASFKGLFLGLFFITVGSSINFHLLFWNFFPIIGLTIGIITLKAAVLFGLARVFSLRGRDLWLFMLGLAQAGEFSIVLFQFMQQTGVINTQLSESLLLVTTMSMVLTPALFIAYDYVVRKEGKPVELMNDAIFIQQPVIIAGVGRFGRTINEMVTANGFRTTVIDSNIAAIDLMRKLGIKAYLGDPSRPELLEMAGLATAEVLVVAIDNPQVITKLVKYARKRRPDLHIITRARDREHVFELYKAGANDIVRETFDSSIRAGRYVIQKLGISEDEAHYRTRGFYRYNRRATRELATVWDPELPIEKNIAYLNRQKDLNKSIDARMGIPIEEWISFSENEPSEKDHNEKIPLPNNKPKGSD